MREELRRVFYYIDVVNDQLWFRQPYIGLSKGAKISHPSSLNVCQVAKDVCGPALSWWKTTSLLFTSYG